MYDLVIKDGRVIDPVQELDAIRDVAFSEGEVKALEDHISTGDVSDVLEAEGMIVTPGLIDLHVHAFWGGTHLGIEPDPISIARGVTTALDAGSAGARNIGAFRKHVLERSDTRLFALLNISGMGQLAEHIGELEDLRWADVEDAVQAGRINQDYVLGMKARLSRSIAGDHDLDALKRALEAAEALDGFLMIHVGDTKTPLEDLVAMLRPGDAVTHTFHGSNHGVLNDDSRVLEGVREAQQKGVVFDIGHGAGSFSFDVAERALADGFYPGNISSDVHYYNVEGPVFDQVTTLSKFMHLGMDLTEVIRRSTESTAGVMGVDDRLGTLRPGATGDATVLRLDEGRFTFTDALGRSVTASERLSHVATVKGGRVYRPWLG